MPLVRINVNGETPFSVDGRPAEEALCPALAELPRGAPVVVMIHGYKHSPSVANHNPHAHMLSLTPVRGGRSLSWPKHMGFGRGNPREGLAIAFGWEARGTIWGAYQRAGQAGIALARLIRSIRARRSGPVDVVAHSLGARVTLAALPHLPARSLGRAILLSAAEFRATAEAALASEAGGSTEFLNVTSGENLMFDLMFERLLQGPHTFERALGGGLSRHRNHWVDLRIDCGATLRHLDRIGFRVVPPKTMVCHWSGYMRPGMFPIYRALIRERRRYPMARLRLPVMTGTSGNTGGPMQFPTGSVTA